MSIFDLSAEYNRSRIIKEQNSLDEELAALRSRLAEAEGVMEEMNKQLVDATKWTYERHVTALADYKTSAWKNACKDYTAYKSKHGQVVGT